jgi:AraC family transcriptional regulator, transcriptional activator of the genes for pyochelin and ferripyochelin receptors
MTSSFSGNINQRDLDKLYQARQILLEDIEHPPSLIELAQKVGLNDYKLKAGFREVFGITVYGYLHAHRMQVAHQRLQSGAVSVTEAAIEVGYSSLSAFSSAFKKFYGIRPSQVIPSN